MDDIDYNEDATSRDHFVEDILKMLDRGSLNDVKIVLDDGEILANKDILMARSEYFETMFSHKKFKEGETDSVDMSHCSKAVMEKIVKFLFSGGLNFDGLSLRQLLDLSHISEMMLLTDFKFAVDDFIIYQLPYHAENVQSLSELISGLKLADQYRLLAVRKFIIDELHYGYGLEKIPKDVSCWDSFKTLPFNLIKEIYKLDRNALTWNYYVPIIKYNHGFEALLVWLSDNEVTEEQKAEIVESFDFADFSVEELSTFVRDSGLYSVDKIDERVIYLRVKRVLTLYKRDINEIKEKLKTCARETLVTEEQKADIMESVDFADFSLEELSTFVRDSGLYSVDKIDERVIYLLHEKVRGVAIALGRRLDNLLTSFKSILDQSKNHEI